MSESGLLYEIMGWAGSAFIVIAYALNSYQKLAADSWIFYVLNITGGVLLIIYSMYKDAQPNIFINAVWVLIGVTAIIRSSLRKHH